MLHETGGTDDQCAAVTETKSGARGTDSANRDAVWPRVTDTLVRAVSWLTHRHNTQCGVGSKKGVCNCTSGGQAGVDICKCWRRSRARSVACKSAKGPCDCCGGSRRHHLPTVAVGDKLSIPLAAAIRVRSIDPSNVDSSSKRRVAGGAVLDVGSLHLPRRRQLSAWNFTYSRSCPAA